MLGEGSLKFNSLDSFFVKAYPIPRDLGTTGSCRAFVLCSCKSHTPFLCNNKLVAFVALPSAAHGALTERQSLNWTNFSIVECSILCPYFTL